VAVNLATMLSKIRPAGSLLIDMFLTYGDAGVFLGADSRFSIADALENLHRMDAAFLRTLITTTRSGVHLIASSERQLSFPVDTTQLRGLINLAADEFPYVVLDVPRADAAALDALDRASTIVIVANQELATVRSAGRMAAALGQRYGKDRVSVVITRYDERAEIGQQDVERVVGRPVAHILPNNYAATVASLNKGRPLVLDNHTKLAGAFSSLAHSLAKLTPSKPEKEKSGGLFSRIAGRR
jgi:Flp pilus assembly CpaE family ATPase